MKKVKGSYADILEDKRWKKVRAVFVWNPRRIWRDMLVLGGWKLSEHEKVILPFVVSDVKKYCSYYKLDRKIFYQFKNKIPYDMYAFCVFLYSINSPRIPVYGFFEHRIIIFVGNGVDGYILFTLMEIFTFLNSNVYVEKFKSFIREAYLINLFYSVRLSENVDSIMLRLDMIPKWSKQELSHD